MVSLNTTLSTQDTLHHLMQKYPIASGWDLEDLHEDKFVLENIVVDVFGICFKQPDRFIFGSGVGSLERAYFELQERMAALDAVDVSVTTHEHYKASLSNGLAAGLTRSGSRARAYYELLERDAVLRSWYGWSQPKPIPDAHEPLPSEFYETKLVEFPLHARHHPSACAGYFGFPRNNDNPLVFGFGSGPELGSAIESARRECVQRLAFLWGEEIPEREPEFQCTAGFHQEWYLYPAHHGVLRDWLEGGNPCTKKVEPTTEVSAGPTFSDLTPPHLKGRMHITRATDTGLLPLLFGADPISSGLPAGLRIHPIA